MDYSVIHDVEVASSISRKRSTVSINQKVEGIKRDFDTEQQKMSLTGLTTFQLYLVNKKIHIKFKDTGQQFRVE